jgi:formate dehydrogenase maturation protein FdhE
MGADASPVVVQPRHRPMTRWERRIERAIELEAQYPAAAEILRFYRKVVETVAQASWPVLLQQHAPAPLPPDFIKRVEATTRPCTEHAPLCSVLRPEGEGGKRFLLCAVCSAEWEFNRVRCPACGNEDKDTLPVYTADEFPHIRIEACDKCRIYLKSIDLTKNGLAVPEVDEIASVSLDLWAADQGYTKLRPNLLGL